MLGQLSLCPPPPSAQLPRSQYIAKKIKEGLYSARKLKGLCILKGKKRIKKGLCIMKEKKIKKGLCILKENEMKVYEY
jgi:hypothetical protein